MILKPENIFPYKYTFLLQLVFILLNIDKNEFHFEKFL